MPTSEPPRFLELATRPAKPRRAGITHVFDKGAPLAGVEALLASFGAIVDVWKFGFGTAYVDRAVASKLQVLELHDVKACPGGTLLEAAWLQGRADAFFDWARNLGFDSVEVSRGATGLPAAAKRDLIIGARTWGLEVFAEVGSKDPHDPASPEGWVDEARRDIDSGASWLVAEGRESGTVGLYAADGSVRAEMVDALETLDGEAPVIYEAPRRAQQAWLVNHVGLNVNLANIALDDVLGVEALRLGLRADTMTLETRAPSAFDEPCPTGTWPTQTGPTGTGLTQTGPTGTGPTEAWPT